MIEYAMISEIGEKENNEDSVRVFINQPLSTYGFVLADGLGGYKNGDVASKLVVECVGAAIENTDMALDTVNKAVNTAAKTTGIVAGSKLSLIA